MRQARFLAELKAGNSIAAKIAMMAMTTRSSIKVKALRDSFPRRFDATARGVRREGADLAAFMRSG